MDRDEYINVHYNNILTGYEGLRDIKRVFNETLGLPYDTASVMHYGPRGFCTDCILLTITELSGERKEFKMGQRINFSVMDIARVNRLYKCEDYYLGLDLPGSGAYSPSRPPWTPYPPSCQCCRRGCLQHEVLH